MIEEPLDNMRERAELGETPGERRLSKMKAPVG
jgi:hypothetical protein